MNIRDELENIKFHQQQIEKSQNTINVSQSFLNKQKKTLQQMWRERFGEDWTFEILLKENCVSLCIFEYDLWGYGLEGIFNEDGDLGVEEGVFEMASKNDLWDNAHEGILPIYTTIEVFDIPSIPASDLDVFCTEASERLGHPVGIEVE